MRARLAPPVCNNSLSLIGMAMLFGSTFSAAPVRLSAQAVSYAGGKPSVGVGDAILCHPGATGAGCFVTATLTYSVTAAGTLGEPKVLTLGSPDLDFTEVVQGTTCRGVVIAGRTCTVAVKFAPRFVGGRRGGIRIVDGAGKTLTSTFLYGTGRGSQVAFDLNTPKTIPEGSRAVVLNGAGELFATKYEAQSGGGVIEYDPPYYIYGHNLRAAGPLFSSLAIDGVGNLYVTGTSGVKELPADGGPPLVLPFGFVGTSSPISVAVDGAGDVFASSASGAAEVRELPAGSSQVNVIRSAAFGTGPIDSLAADATTNIYVNTNSRDLYEFPAGGGSFTKLNAVFPDREGGGFFSLDSTGSIYVPGTENTKDVLVFPSGKTPPTAFDLYDLGLPYASLLPFDIHGVFPDDGSANLYVTNQNSVGEELILRYQRRQGVPLLFGTVGVTNTATATTRYFNDGNAPLTVTPIFDDLEFKLLSTEPAGCLIELAPTQYCSLTISYTPVKTGDQDRTLTLKTNGALDPVLHLQSHNVGIVTPVLSVPSGVYTQPQTISITAPTPAAPVFYTLDGTAPTAASTPYTGPITVGATTTLEAVSIRNGVPSPTAVGLYTIASGGTGAVNYAQGFGEGCTQGLYGGFQCAGSAYVNGKRLRLTGPLAYQGGIARNTIPIARTGFTTNFTFQLTQAMADGFTFLLETDRPLAHGGYGKSLGYAGIADSAAVKFDLFGNEGEGPNSVGVYFDGAMPTVPAVSLAGSGIDLHSGHVMNAGITYTGSTLNLQLTDTITLASWSHAFPVDLSAHAGGPTATLFPGFTGGTGSTSAIQNILSWSYVSGAPVASPPVPQTPALPNFPDGVSGQGIRLNGAASINRQGALQLIDDKFNEAASAFYTKPVSISAFTTDFTFQSVDQLADGITFTIQNAGLGALGGRGLQLGYGGIPNSVALKLDFYNNAGEGDASTGLYVNGATPTIPAVTLPYTVSSIAKQGAPVPVHVTYDGSVMTVTIGDPFRDETWTHAFPVNIPAEVGGKTAYVGFTGGAGTKSMIGQITRWTFSNP